MSLLPEVHLQLRPCLLALAPRTRIVSHDCTPCAFVRAAGARCA